MRDTQGGSQSYMKRRRERRGVEMSRRKRGTHDERDRSMQLSLPKVFSIADTHRDSQNWIGKRRGKEEREVF